MSSITEAIPKTSDELKEEVDAVLSKVDQDLDVIKEDFTPEHIINDVIMPGRFQKIRDSVHYLREHPLAATCLSLAALLFVYVKVTKR